MKKKPETAYRFEFETGTVIKRDEFVALKYVKDCFYRRKKCRIIYRRKCIGYVRSRKGFWSWKFIDETGKDRAGVSTEYDKLKAQMLRLKDDKSIQVAKQAASIRKYIRKWGLKDQFRVDNSVVLRGDEFLHGCTIERIK